MDQNGKTSGDFFKNITKLILPSPRGRRRGGSGHEWSFVSSVNTNLDAALLHPV